MTPTYNYTHADGIDDLEDTGLTLRYARIIQALSREVAEGTARPGDIVIGEDHFAGNEGTMFIPIRVTHEFKEWQPREKGGNSVGSHLPDSDVVQKAKAESFKFGSYHTPEGNRLEETYNIFGITADGGILVIPMTSAKIKVYRKFAKMIRNFEYNGKRVPLYAFMIRLTTERIEGKLGTYFNPVLAPALQTLEASLVDPESTLFQKAQDARDLILNM